MGMRQWREEPWSIRGSYWSSGNDGKVVSDSGDLKAGLVLQE